VFHLHVVDLLEPVAALTQWQPWSPLPARACQTTWLGCWINWTLNLCDRKKLPIIT